MTRKKIKTGTLISGTGTNLHAIISACREEKIDANMVFAGSDRPDAAGLEMAARNDINTFYVDYRAIIEKVKTDPGGVQLPGDFFMNEVEKKQRILPKAMPADKREIFMKSRAIAEKKLLDHILPYQIDLLVLAGFMRTLTPYFIDRFNSRFPEPRIINIHPSLLPAFPGTDGYGDTFRYGCKVGGCTVHFVDYGEDTGRIIGQKAFEIEDTDTIADVRKKGLELEWQLYPQCIQKLADTLS